MIYGWWEWSRSEARRHIGEKTEEIAIRRLNQQELFGWLGVGMAITLLWGFVAGVWLPGVTLPYHDAATTAFSLIAQYLMVRRYLECWMLWVAVDVVSPLNYLEKGLYLGLAVYGHVDWNKTRKEQECEASSRPG